GRLPPRGGPGRPRRGGRLAAVAKRFGVPVEPYPWPRATGMVEIQDRPGLPSLVRVWTGDRTLTFFENPGSVVLDTLARASGFVTVVYRTERIGETRVQRILRVTTY